MKSPQPQFLLLLFSLSIATTPLIMTILLLNGLGRWLEDLGVWSEEVFRAEQLPVLNLSETK